MIRITTLCRLKKNIMSTATMERPIITVSILLLLASIWIFGRPYQGFIHDSKLYALQALSHLHADIFSTDIFLKYESQENYTIFSGIYAFVIRIFGANKANILLLVLGQGFWISSAYFFSGIFSRKELRYFSLAFLFVMPPYYGIKGIFSFGEPFLTPRIYGEAFYPLFLLFCSEKAVRILPYFISLVCSCSAHRGSQWDNPSVHLSVVAGQESGSFLSLLPRRFRNSRRHRNITIQQNTSYHGSRMATNCSRA